MANHQIWGKVESPSDSSLGSASIDQSYDIEPIDAEWFEPKQRRARSLPADYDMHHVVFHDESRSSDFGTNTSNTSNTSGSGSVASHLAEARANARQASPRQQQAAERVRQQPDPPGRPAGTSRRSGGQRATPARVLLGVEDMSPPPQQLDHDGGGGGDGREDDGEDSARGEITTWSKGSKLHESGKCKPCHYVHTKLGCLNGEECNFCHISHTKKSRPRPCKTKRMQCKRIVSMLEAASAKDPEQFAEATRVLSSQSTYLRTVLKTKLNQDGTAEGEPERGAHSGYPQVGGAAMSVTSSGPGGDPEAAATDKPALVSALLHKLKEEQQASRISTSSTKAAARAKRATRPPPENRA